jgi:hypothetical protein
MPFVTPQRTVLQVDQQFLALEKNVSGVEEIDEDENEIIQKYNPHEKAEEVPRIGARHRVGERKQEGRADENREPCPSPQTPRFLAHFLSRLFV